MLGVLLTLTGAAHQVYESRGASGPPTPQAATAIAEPERAGTSATPPAPSRSAGPHAGVPRRLDLPALGVSAPVVPIASSRGVLTPPDDPRKLGWWSQGSRPGARRGSALITGHTVHTGGGALDDLELLRRGDEVAVATTGGVVRYAVAQVAVYTKSTLAEEAQSIFSQSVRGRLVLVTCEDWNGEEYESNVVVVAEPVG